MFAVSTQTLMIAINATGLERCRLGTLPLACSHRARVPSWLRLAEQWRGKIPG
jgi:hypothetical protein